MKIYDCFSYWDEDLLLDLRLNILNDYVDYFVIVEGNKTWQNNPKKLRFDIDKFPDFKKKIVYQRYGTFIVFYHQYFAWCLLSLCNVYINLFTVVFLASSY